jgi:hypothetical protein
VEVDVEWTVKGGGMINPNGVFTPETAGKYIITAEYMSITGASTVIVIPGKAAGIIITPSNPSVTIGDRTKFYANITDSFGNKIDDYPKWSVNSTAGEIYVDGVFFAKTPGSWNITATFESVIGTTGVDVNFGKDTDSDGMDDRWEFENGLEPLNGNDAFENRDDDSLSNLQEFQNGTDPFDEDTDDDGIDDYWEAFFGLDPLDPGDAVDDNDGDGFTNLEEYEALTDPNDPDSHPIIQEPETGEAGYDRYFEWIAILVIIIIIVVFTTGAFVYYRRRSEDRFDNAPGEPPDIIDVQYDFDEDADDYIDFEERKTPPPPPPIPPPPPPAIIDVDYVPGKRRGKRKDGKRKRGMEKPGKKPEKVDAELVDDDSADDISWDDEGDDDVVSWDDHRRYGRGSEETEIEWDDEDRKPYSKAKKNHDDDLQWEE